MALREMYRAAAQGGEERTAARKYMLGHSKYYRSEESQYGKKNEEPARYEKKGQQAKYE